MNRKNGFTLVELLVVIAIIGILIGMLLPGVQKVREAARRAACANKMRQMTVGLMNYESAHKHFPPGIQSNSMMGRGLNWSSFILPFMEQDALYGVLRDQSNNFKQPNWVGGAIADSAEEILDIYLCPSDEMGGENTVRGRTPGGANPHGKSNYIGVLGPKLSGDFPTLENLDQIFIDQSGPIDESELFTLRFPGILYLNSKVTFGDITDGTSNTFIVGERDGYTFPPDQWDIVKQRAAATWCGAVYSQGLHQCLGATNEEPEFTINSVINTGFARQKPFASLHPGGANFGRADGSIGFVSETISGKIYQEMGTKAGGEVLNDN